MAPGHHHITVVEAGRTAHLAGQCPLDRRGSLVAGPGHTVVRPGPAAVQGSGRSGVSQPRSMRRAGMSVQSRPRVRAANRRVTWPAPSAASWRALTAVSRSRNAIPPVGRSCRGAGACSGASPWIPVSRWETSAAS
ncbi:RidA family protein [Streptomyces erythrochromogenes]|uniref:RidA family protein n=1 Tax=Streptomyces erythrochromogenes TaxID=285574 RepID=UPI0036A33394